MRELHLSAKAQRDLKGIWSYTFTQWDEDQARKYLQELKTKLARLCRNPNLGRPREAIRPGLFSLRVGSHIAYYTVTPKLIRVQRVLHQQMDADAHL